MLNIIFGQSKYYVDNLSENTKRGIREKLRLGEYPGFAPIGYVNDGKGKILVDESTAPLVKKLYLLCAENKYTLDDLKKLAAAFDLVSKRSKKPLSVSNVQRILTNVFYYGVFLYNGELFQGAHAAIITKELYDKVQEVLSLRSRPKLNKNRYFAFRGLMRCAECGCTITAEHQKGHNYYRCTKKKGKCTQQGYIREEKLNVLMSEAIKKVSLDDANYKAMLDELEREETLLRAEKIHNDISREARLREIDEQLSRLLDLFVEGIISADEYKQKKASLINKKTHLLESPVSGTSDGKWLEPMKNFLTLAHQARYIASAGTPAEKGNFLKRAGSNFRLFGKNLLFSYNYPFKILEKSQNEDMG